MACRWCCIDENHSRSIGIQRLFGVCTSVDEVMDVIRCSNDVDELDSLGIFNTVWPQAAVTIEAVHSYRDSALHYVDYLARLNGLPVGSGTGAIFGYRPQRAETLITVLPEHRRSGIGTALLSTITQWSRDLGAHEIEASVLGHDVESLSFARHRGLIEDRRQVSLVLPLSGRSTIPVAPPIGIDIVTWAQRPDLAVGMYEVDVEIHRDIPGFDNIQVEPFQEWMTHNMRRPTDSPEATFIAVDGDIVAGFAKLSLTGPTIAGHSMTGVRRAWRGRGIAGALKAASINWALANGYTELYTSNEERNTPIQRLNARLGYQPRTDRIHLVGPLPG